MVDDDAQPSETLPPEAIEDDADIDIDIYFDDDEDDDDEDDDMADLFSFGSEEVTSPNKTATANTSSSSSTDTAATTAATNASANGNDGSSTTSPISSPRSSSNSPNRGTAVRQNRAKSSDSSDSFLDMLEEEGGGGGGSTPSSSSAAGSQHHEHHHDDIDQLVPQDHDKETQDILNWLDDDDNDHNSNDGEDTIVFGEAESDMSRDDHDYQQAVRTSATTTNTAAAAAAAGTGASPEPVPTPPTPTPTPEPTPTVVALPPRFDTLQEALKSSEATTSQIRQLYAKEQRLPSTLALAKVTAHDPEEDSTSIGAAASTTASTNNDTENATDTHLRPELWCRMICGKTAAQMARGGQADSFTEWQIPTGIPDLDTDQDTAAAQTVVWMKQQAVVLAQQAGLTTACSAVTTVDEDLTKLLLYHYYQQPVEARSTKDRLVPPIAATLLAAAMPLATASVVLGQLIPNHMPLVALQPRERWDAALLLHQEFYFLACYHLPLLVTHLDRYLPGWYWPKLPPVAPVPVVAVSNDDDNTSKDDNTNKDDHTTLAITAMARNLEQQGQLPLSWLLSHLAGECEGTSMPMQWLLQLWDDMLTVEKNDARFFLTLAVLEQAADQLLVLTGEELIAALQSALKLQDMTEEWLPEWWQRARTLQSCTPESVVVKLQNAEDQAVQQAIVRRQERVEAEPRRGSSKKRSPIRKLRKKRRKKRGLD
jgi:hypothetical protein